MFGIGVGRLWHVGGRLQRIGCWVPSPVGIVVPASRDEGDVDDSDGWMRDALDGGGSVVGFVCDGSGLVANEEEEEEARGRFEEAMKMW